MSKPTYEQLEQEHAAMIEALQAIQRHMEMMGAANMSTVWHIANNALTKLEEIEK